ncbi:hypothetical protein SAMN02787148_1143 [Burkholderia vietnamiensis]|nr:hypothetical protein SAMN02787148_1143 [Burkholderia vietnamiensis]
MRAAGRWTVAAARSVRQAGSGAHRGARDAGEWLPTPANADQLVCPANAANADRLVVYPANATDAASVADAAN